MIKPESIAGADTRAAVANGPPGRRRWYDSSPPALRTVLEMIPIFLVVQTVVLMIVWWTMMRQFSRAASIVLTNQLAIIASTRQLEQNSADLKQLVATQHEAIAQHETILKTVEKPKPARRAGVPQ